MDEGKPGNQIDDYVNIWHLTDWILGDVGKRADRKTQ